MNFGHRLISSYDDLNGNYDLSIWTGYPMSSNGRRSSSQLGQRGSSACSGFDRFDWVSTSWAQDWSYSVPGLPPEEW